MQQDRDRDGNLGYNCLEAVTKQIIVSRIIWIVSKMAFTPVYVDNVTTVYKARKCSSAYFFSCLCLVIKILLPLLLISRSVWIKSDTFNEQPSINFKHKFIMMVEKIRPTTEPLFYSTFTHLNQAFDGPNIRVPSVRVSGLYYPSIY